MQLGRQASRGENLIKWRILLEQLAQALLGIARSVSWECGWAMAGGWVRSWVRTAVCRSQRRRLHCDIHSTAGHGQPWPAMAGQGPATARPCGAQPDLAGSMAGHGRGHGRPWPKAVGPWPGPWPTMASRCLRGLGLKNWPSRPARGTPSHLLHPTALHCPTMISHRAN